MFPKQKLDRRAAREMHFVGAERRDTLRFSLSLVSPLSGASFFVLSSLASPNGFVTAALAK